MSKLSISHRPVNIQLLSHVVNAKPSKAVLASVRQARKNCRLHMNVFRTLLTLAMMTASTLAADGPIRHVVHFKFKPEADQTQVQKVVESFAALRSSIPVIESMESGTNVSPEGLDHGYTHCWIISFKNAADRDIYLVHPAHKAFVEVLKPILDEALVVDFIAAPAK